MDQIAVQQQKNTMQCEKHNKDLEFFCQMHSLFCCNKCISAHIDCQVKGKFQPLEDIHELFTNNYQITMKDIELNIEQKIGEAIQLDNKMKSLQALRNTDIQTISNFFEEMKKKADFLLSQAIKNYNQNNTKLDGKLQERKTQINNSLAHMTKAKTEVQKLNADVNSLSATPCQMQTQSVFAQQKLDEINYQISRPLESPDISDEIELMINKEEVFAELGVLSSVYENLDSQMVAFLKENLQSMIKVKHLISPDILAQQNALTSFRTPENEEEAEQKRRVQEMNEVFSGGNYKEADKDNNAQQQVNEDNADESTFKYVQLRYSSNEIYIFNEKLQKFETYFLFTSKKYTFPFVIFNNCCSVIVKNHLVFLFGGEDPSAFDKSSQRAFCLNLDKKTESNKIIVYELDEMLQQRSEFTVAIMNSFIYLVSGYNSNQQKDKRVIQKCEKFDLRSKKFYEIRDINYPRQNASCVSVNNQCIYVFNGYNPNYLNVYVDKIEKYTVNLNDWAVLKFHVSEQLPFEATMKATAFQIIILGGTREGIVSRGYYTFDFKNLMLTIGNNCKIVPENDEFINQNNLFVSKSDQNVYVCSGNFVKQIYKISFNPINSQLKADVIKEEIKL